MTNGECGQQIINFFGEEGSTSICRRPYLHEGTCWQVPFFSDRNYSKDISDE